MKTLFLITLAFASTALFAGPGHNHDHSHDHGHADDKKKHEHHEHENAHANAEAAPFGGRIVEATPLNYEFFARPDGHMVITFLDADHKATDQEVAALILIGGDRSKPVTLQFKKSGSSYVSTEKLQPDTTIPVIIQLKASPESSTQYARFSLNLSQCPSCDFREYACTCH